MSEPIAGRYRPVAPLPAIGGVERELAVDQVAEHRVAIARLAAGARLEEADRLLRAHQDARQACLAPVLDVVLLEGGEIAHVEAQADGPLLGAAMLAQDSALLVAADIADALAALHVAGLAHGDLGADAVVLDASGRPLVAGAGLAAAHALIAGGRAPTASDDMRALGVVLYALVTGQQPAAQPTAPMTLVPGLSPALNGLMLALLSDDARRPPPPAAATAERLRAMVGAPLPTAFAAAPLPVTPPPRMPRRGLSDAALAAIVGALALGAIVLALAVVDGGSLGGTTSTGGVPTFTLPQPGSLTLTVPPSSDTLPLPGVVTTDTGAPPDTSGGGTEVFTDTNSTVPPAPTDTSGGATGTGTGGGGIDTTVDTSVN